MKTVKNKLRLKILIRGKPYHILIFSLLVRTSLQEMYLLYLPLFRHLKIGQHSSRSFAGEKVHVCGSLDGQ